MPRKVPQLPLQEVIAGDDWVLPLRFRIRSGNVDFIDDDLTGWTFASSWVPFLGSEDKIDFSVTLTLPNMVEIRASETQTREMSNWGQGVFDLQGVRAGETRTFVRGTTMIVGDVTV